MTFEYFFWEKSQIFAMEDGGASLGFDLYSAGHLIWLAAIVAAGIIISSIYRGLGGGNSVWIRSNAVENAVDRRVQERRRANMRRFFAVALLLSEIYKDTVLAVTGNFKWEYLPFHLCGLAIFALLLDAFAGRQKLTEQLISYAFMPGAVSALLFCNWTEYPFLNFMNIHSFLFHGWIFFYFLMRYRSGEYRPDYRGLWKTVGIMILLVPPLFAFNSHFGTNFLFVNEASEGSPLVPIWNLLGTRFGHPGYLAGCVLLVIAVFHALYLLYRVLGRRQRRHS